MPVNFDNVGTRAAFSRGIDLTYTCGAEMEMLVAFIAPDGTRSVSAASYATVPLTKKGATGVSGAQNPLEVWVLTSPPVGIGTFSCAITSNSAWAMTIVSTYNNMKSSDLLGTLASATYSAADGLVHFTVSSTTVDLVVAAFRVDDKTSPLNVNNGTVRASVSAAAELMVMVTITGAAALVISASSNSPPHWSMLGLPLKFSADSVVLAIPSMSLTGAGF